MKNFTTLQTGMLGANYTLSKLLKRNCVLIYKDIG